MKELFGIETLEEFEHFLKKQNQDEIRRKMLDLFYQLCIYRNISDWNKAVRLCEGLAIIGWGEHEPVQAVRGKFYNGNPETKFINRYSQARFLDAIWSKRKAGYTLEQGRTSYHFSPQLPGNESIAWDYNVTEIIENSKFETQRNWIPRNPIRITRGVANCYETSEELVDRINELVNYLDKEMRPESYGTDLNQIIVIVSMSYSRVNHVIASDDIKTKNTSKLYVELKKLYTTDEIQNNCYFLRHRFDFGGFSKKSGKIKIELRLEKEFSELPFRGQLEKFTEYLHTGIDMVVKKLKSKKLNYDLDNMQSDFNILVSNWAEQDEKVL
jgi:hypothetical protein